MGRAPCCEKVGMKKGRWTEEEDEILRKYIHENGEGSWRSLPKNAGLKRCGKSCRLRWMNYLRDDLKRGNISSDEDGMIIKLHNTYGNRWSLIAGQLPGRTDNEIKNYWNSHLSRKVHRFRKPFCEIPLCIKDLAKIDAGLKQRGGKLPIKKETRKNNTTTKKESKLKKKVDDESITPIPLIVETLKEVSPACLEKEGQADESPSQENGEEEEKKGVLVCTEKDKEQSDQTLVGPFEGLDTNILGDEEVVINSSNGVICISSNEESGEGGNGERFYNTPMGIDEWTNWDWEIVEDAHNHTMFEERDEMMFPWLWNTENDRNGMGESETRKALAAWLLS